LTKFTYFIFYKKSSIIKDLVYVFTKVILLNYGLLKEIIFNKNKLFTSKFYKSLIL
ncbi:uncharacterized protein CLUP02_10481, partial [Colletotrichum lupini]